MQPVPRGRTAVRATLIALGAQAALWAVGRALSRAMDVGEETDPGIERFRMMGPLELRPRSTELDQVHLDLVMAGALLDLSRAHPAPGGVDVVLNAAFGGATVQVPSGWRVWWESRGPGGVGVHRGSPLVQVADSRLADLRVHARVLFGGAEIRTVDGTGGPEGNGLRRAEPSPDGSAAPLSVVPPPPGN